MWKQSSVAKCSQKSAFTFIRLHTPAMFQLLTCFHVSPTVYTSFPLREKSNMGDIARSVKQNKTKDEINVPIALSAFRDKKARSVAERQNSNPKTLGSIPWRGRVRNSFSISNSQLYCVQACLCLIPLRVYGTQIKIAAHIIHLS